MSQSSSSAQPALPGANRKAYDGSIVVAHPVQEGETLTKIASIFRFQRWEPIWIYNSQIFKTIGDDQNLIRKGVTILVPRSEKGYDAVIRKIEAARDILDGEADQILAKLEGEWYELQAHKVIIDTTADIFKTAFGLALKAASAANAAKAAASAAGQARIAAYHAMRTESREVASQMRGLFSGRLMQAKELAGKASAASSSATKALQRKALGTAAKVADAGAQRTTGDEKFSGFDTANKYKETTRKVYEALAKGGPSILDVSELLLDYIKPSMVAEAFVLVTSGENTETTYDRQRKAVAEATAAGVEALSDKIDRLKAERELLYG